MVELDDLKTKLKTYEQPLAEMKSSLDLENKEKRIEELHMTMSEPDFWTNTEKATRTQKELGALQNDIADYKKLSGQYEELMLLIDMANEDEDASVIDDVRESEQEFEENFDSVRIRTLLSDSMTTATRLLPCIPEPAGQKPVIGAVCSSECTHAGLSGMGFRWKCLIRWKVTRQG